MNKYTFNLTFFGAGGRPITSRLMEPGTGEPLKVEAASLIEAIDRIKPSLDFGPGIELIGLSCDRVIDADTTTIGTDFAYRQAVPANQPPAGSNPEGPSSTG